ncbi:hypothetical protein D3C71_1051250 [compost metagenome]
MPPPLPEVVRVLSVTLTCAPAWPYTPLALRSVVRVSMRSNVACGPAAPAVPWTSTALALMPCVVITVLAACSRDVAEAAWATSTPVLLLPNVSMRVEVASGDPSAATSRRSVPPLDDTCAPFAPVVPVAT